MIEIAFVAHEIGQIIATVFPVDDDRLAAHGAVERLPDSGYGPVADHRSQCNGDFPGWDDENARDGELNEFVEYLGDRGAGLPHADIGDFLQRVLLILAQHSVFPVRIP